MEEAGGSRCNTRSVSDLATMSSVGGVLIAIDTSGLVADSHKNQDGRCRVLTINVPRTSSGLCTLSAVNDGGKCYY